MALAAPGVDLTVVGTDDAGSHARSCLWRRCPFLRPTDLASDTASGIAPVLHALAQLPEVTDVLLLQPFSTPARSRRRGGCGYASPSQIRRSCVGDPKQQAPGMDVWLVANSRVTAFIHAFRYYAVNSCHLLMC